MRPHNISLTARAALSFLAAFAGCFGAAARGQETGARGQEAEARASAAQVVAFVGVSVVPVDRERVVENQTVVVRGGRIAEIGPADKVKVPAGATRIDGRGKYLTPGLADMHAHLFPGDGSANDGAAQQLTLYLANGVTTLRNMIGAPAHTVLRERIAAGKVPGPTLYTAGPPVLGKEAVSAEVAERIVAAQKQAGYDLLKVHEGLKPEVYDAIIAAARKAGLPVAGHVTATVGLRRALAARQATIEHLDGYLQALVPENSPVPAPPGQVVLGPALEQMDERRLPELARATREAGVCNTPTLALLKIVVSSDAPEEFLKWPEMKYIPANMRQGFAKQKASIKAGDAPADERQRYVELRNKTVKALHEAGAKLLVGPDSPQLFLVPGFATHREMAALAEAGLSPYAVLEAATRNAAQCLGASNEFGTVEVGKRADLLLLDANPLQSVGNLSRIAGVMVGGRWHTKEELNKMLEAVATIHRLPAKVANASSPLDVKPERLPGE